jgi:hypothetical protein
MDGGVISLAYVGRSDDKSSRKAKPTEADRKAADRIKKLWSERLKGRVTQEEVGQRFRDVGEDQDGISQSAISQYLNGQMPINTFAVLFFAHELQVHPTEIRDDLPEFVLAQLRHTPPNSKREPPRKVIDFPFPFSREEWGSVGEDMKTLIVNQMINAVEMAEKPAPRGRRDNRPKS